MSEKRPDERPKVQIDERAGRGKRIGLMVVAFVIAVLGIAWFHGGEEPLRPIIQPIDTPEAAQ